MLQCSKKMRTCVFARSNVGNGVHTCFTVAVFLLRGHGLWRAQHRVCVWGVLVCTNTNSILTEAPLFRLGLDCPELTPSPPLQSTLLPKCLPTPLSLLFPLLRFLGLVVFCETRRLSRLGLWIYIVLCLQINDKNSKHSAILLTLFKWGSFCVYFGSSV